MEKIETRFVVVISSSMCLRVTVSAKKTRAKPTANQTQVNDFRQSKLNCQSHRCGMHFVTASSFVIYFFWTLVIDFGID